MNTDLFRLGKSDFVKGLVTAVFAAVVAVLYNATQTPDFNVLTLDWGKIFNAAIYGLIGYLGKNFVSDSSGKVFGKLG